jgi:hypothetical protein
MASFRRMAAACVVTCLCLTAGAWGATRYVVHSAKPKSHHHRAPQTKGKGKHRPKKAKKLQTTSRLTSVAASVSPSVTTAAPMLFGDRTVESTVDNNPAGMAEAFPFTTGTAGQALTLSVYVDSHTKATKMIAGIYSNANGHPGALLASGSWSAPQIGNWDTISLPSTGVTSGQSYWLAILGTGGASYFRDRDSGPCSSETSSQTTLKSLPGIWKSGQTWRTCPVSMYIGGTPAKVATSDPGSTTTTTTTTTGGSLPVPPLPVAPLNILPPTVSGTTAQGQTLSTTNGTWSDNSSTFTYTWQDCDSNGANCTGISGATGSSFTLRSADVGHTIRAVVTATNSGGSASAASSATTAVAPAPVTKPANSAAPVISGSATQGNTLTTSNGSWSGNPTSYSYVWQDCNSSGASCTAISGATSSSYALQSSDVAHTIRSVVTASNSAGSASASSSATSSVTSAPPAAPTNTAAPTVSGTTTQGSTVSTSNGSWTGSPTSYAYAWQDCNSSGASCAKISGATASSYTLQASDVGDTVRSVVTASNAGGSAGASSSAVGPVASSGGSGGGGGGSTGSGTVPCALTHAAGADPNNSCWATHTGVQGATGITEAQIKANPAAVGFTKHNGDLVITQSGTTIDHMWIVGCVQIADGADNTTIKDSLITSNGDACSGDNAGGSAINTGQGPNIAKNTLIEDTTVDGGTPAYGSHDAGITLDGGEVLRVNLFGFAQGFISDSNTAAAPALFQDDYGHDYYGCSHDDGTWFNSSSYVTFEHGWIMTNDSTQQGSAGCSTGALTGGSDYGPQDHVVFDNSYGEGVTGEDTHAGCGSTSSAYTNNALSNDTKGYGSGFDANDSGNSWAKNYVAETSAAVSDPETGC